MLRRPPKRSCAIKTYVRPEIEAALRQLVAKRGGVITLSEYLAEWAERHVLEERALEIAKQTIAGRVGTL